MKFDRETTHIHLYDQIRKCSICKYISLKGNEYPCNECTQNHGPLEPVDNLIIQNIRYIKEDSSTNKIVEWVDIKYFVNVILQEVMSAWKLLEKQMMDLSLK